MSAIERDPVVEGLREQIAATDRELVSVVNRRLRLVGQLWDHKRAQEQPLTAPERERWLYEHLAASNEGPMSGGALDELVAFVLDLTKRELS